MPKELIPIETFIEDLLTEVGVKLTARQMKDIKKKANEIVGQYKLQKRPTDKDIIQAVMDFHPKKPPVSRASKLVSEPTLIGFYACYEYYQYLFRNNGESE